MKKIALLSIGFCAIAVVACGGAKSTPLAQSAAIPVVAPAHYLTPKFTLQVPVVKAPSGSAAKRKPKYISAATQSVKIVLNTVDGVSPSPSPLANVTNIALGSCSTSCSVSGPAVPGGTDNFTVTAYDAPDAGGNALSTNSASFAVVANQANGPFAMVLNGIPHTFVLSSPPPASAGTAFLSPAPLTLAVNDAAGNTITGTYSSPVLVTTNDFTSLTQASALSVNGATAATTVAFLASTDALTLAYGGRAIVPSTLSVSDSATGATQSNVLFAPVLSPIVPNPTHIDLNATTGAGSSGTVTVSEIGWSGTPYSQAFTVAVPTGVGGCDTIATMTGNLTSTTGTTFTVTTAGSPVPGTCTAVLADGAGQHANVTLTYSTSSIGVNAIKRRTVGPH
jgi:hypothetical protein